MALWEFQVPEHRDLAQVDEVFSAASYQYVLYGMGFETHARDSARQSRNAAKAQELFEENSKLASKLVANLPANRKLLDTIGR